MTTTTERLGDLVAAAREGIGFYEYAVTRIDLITMTVVMRSMAMVRYDLVKALGPEVPTHRHQLPDEESVHLQAQRVYRRMRAEMCRIPSGDDVAELVRHEATLIEALGDLLRKDSEGSGHPRTSECLRVHLPRMQTCQAELERQQLHLAAFRDALIHAEETINEPGPARWQVEADQGETPRAVGSADR